MNRHKVLIIGGGYASIRYVESIIWDDSYKLTMCGTEIKKKTKDISAKYALPYLKFSDLTKSNINQFDCIIVALPCNIKLRYIKTIIDDFEYTNALIIEKPLTIDENEISNYQTLLSKLDKCAIVCQRDFFPELYSIPEAECFNIIWPSYDNDAIFIKRNMLPHVLSWMINIDNSISEIRMKSENTYVGKWRGRDFKIQFVERTNSLCMMVNNKVYPDFQYRKFNKEIVKLVLSSDKNISSKSINRAIKVSNLLISLD